ncbi:MAG: DUF1549 domain-containing protein, partial [Bauldia litoralis]
MFALAPLSSSDDVDFRRDVWPILEMNCLDCHDEGETERARLGTRSGLFEGFGSQAPVVPFDPEASRLYQLVTLDPGDPDRMPKDGLPLGEDEIETIRQWIAQGAKWTDPKDPSKVRPKKPEAREEPVPTEDDDPVEQELARLKREIQVPAKIDFARDIRPILSDNCFFCHGPDANRREGKLRLDTRDGALGERRRADPVIIPGDLLGSELVQRILAEEDYIRMPPVDSGRVLEDRERRLLAAWIEQGAEWQDHWSFVPPRQAEVPSNLSQWQRNPIDGFVARRLEEEGLEQAPEADRRTLIRRVTFDLTGLPPTLAEVEAFVADEREDAYAHLVDRLLSSPRYGEHRARYWLDAARYGDTHGLHLDNYREMWPYRDWVVRAFNDNLPYDRFVTEQLAGDLLDNPTQDQLVASGFNRNHVTTNEGGSILEEVYVRNVVDRTSTAGTVFMGLTLGCAVCHDHKFDPVSQQEFFELFAFFNSMDGSAMDGNVKNSPPFMKVPSEDQRKRRAELAANLEAFERQIEAKIDTLP